MTLGKQRKVAATCFVVGMIVFLGTASWSSGDFSGPLYKDLPTILGFIVALVSFACLFLLFQEFLFKASLVVVGLVGSIVAGIWAYEHYTTEWTCVEEGQTMYSISDKGEIGAAEEACTCTGMADFERRNWGRVDYAGLNKDHGCDFD